MEGNRGKKQESISFLPGRKSRGGHALEKRVDLHQNPSQGTEGELISSKLSMMKII